jgi:class 3 adenylate cyclase
VVHSPQSGLDYFGGTVNVAARAQGAAGAGEVVWTASLERADPALAAWVQARGLRVERFEGELKGIHGPVALRRCTPA